MNPVEIETIELSAMLMFLLGTMPAEGEFSQIVKRLAETNDDNFSNLSGKYLGDLQADFHKLTEELTNKYGSTVDLRKLQEAWRAS